MFAFSLRKKVSGIEAELEQIKRELRELTVDLPELQRKMVRVLRNTARERARMEELDKAPGEGAESSLPEQPQSPSATGPFLTPRQKVIQQQILRRRAGG